MNCRIALAGLLCLLLCSALLQPRQEKPKHVCLRQKNCGSASGLIITVSPTAIPKHCKLSGIDIDLAHEFAGTSELMCDRYS